MESVSQQGTTVMYNYKEDKQQKEKEESGKDNTKNVEYKELKLKLPKKVNWTEDTIDNEHMNKKKSKICCIFKKPRLNPDDTSSNSCSSCDEKGKNAYERPMHYDRKKVK
jgi:protein phosphatase 1 regulatory subunit 11